METKEAFLTDKPIDNEEEEMEKPVSLTTPLRSKETTIN